MNTHSIMRAWLRCMVWCFVTLSTFGYANTPLFDGGFESGTFQGWVPAGSGSAIVATRATCFSDYDTTALSIRGNFAGLLRGVDGNKDDLPTLTSRSFVAGSGVAFLALSELRDKNNKDEQYPFALIVNILDGSGKTLLSRPMSTTMADLVGGCPSSPNDQSFVPLFIDTREFAGKPIKIQFQQHFDIAITGAFTLIDDVVVTGINELPLFHSYPFAIAGVGRTSNGTLMLEAEQPALGTPSNWQFSWYINGESTPRPYFNPCLDNLEVGQYTATLYVRVNHQLVTDTIKFIVPIQDSASSSSEDGTATATSTSSSVSNTSTSNDVLCNVRHPSQLSTSSTEDETKDEADETADTTDIIEATALSGVFISPISPGVATLILKSSPASEAVNVFVDKTRTIKDAFILLEGAANNDELKPPTQTGMTITCETGHSCTFSASSGTLKASAYESVFQDFKLVLNSSKVTIKIGVRDSALTQKTVNGSIASSTPTLSVATNAPFNAATDLQLYSSLNIVSPGDVKITSVILKMTGGAAATDTFKAPVGVTTPPTVCSGVGSAAECKWEGENTAANYSSAIKSVIINLENTSQDRVVTLTLTDKNGATDSESSIININ